LLRTGWHYSNIETLGHISSELYRGNCTGRSGACIGQSDPGDWHDAQYSLNFGTWANRTVPCALHPTPYDGGWGPRDNPWCGGGDPATPGALTLPEGRKFLLADFMSQWKFLTANPADNILPRNLTALGNRSSDVCAQFEPNGLEVFTGLWCRHTSSDSFGGRNAR